MELQVMAKKRFKIASGFTITELVIAIVISAIVILGISLVVADSHKGWVRMYDRIYSGVVSDAYVARGKFDFVIRKSSRENFSVDSAGNWIEVYWYAGSGSTVLDRYARFYVSGSNLNLEYGTLNPRATLNVETVCGNVSACVFKSAGRSAQMILTLDDGEQTVKITSSAVMHNY